MPENINIGNSINDTNDDGFPMVWFPPRPILDALGIAAEYQPACGTGSLLTHAAGFILSNPPFTLDHRP